MNFFRVLHSNKHFFLCFVALLWLEKLKHFSATTAKNKQFKKQTMFPVHFNSFNSPFLCLDTSTLVTYLYRVQCAEQHQQQRVNSSSAATSKNHCYKLWNYRLLSAVSSASSSAYRRLVKIKSVQYVISAVVIARVFYFSSRVLRLHHHHHLQKSEQQRVALEGHRPFNPLLVGLHGQYHFFNGITLSCIALFGLYAVAIDWLVFFCIDFSLIQGAHQLIVLNGRHFVLLNSSSAAVAGGGGGNKGGKINNASKLTWTRLRRTASVYRRAWSGRSTGHHQHHHFSCPSLASFPTLSSKVRAQAVVYSTLLQSVVIFLNLSFGNFSPY